MDVRAEYLRLILRRLSYLQSEVILANSLNLTDINIYAENFYRDFFNELGYTFNNTNFHTQNAAYIDLIDNTNKIAIQVTSQNDNDKIFHTIEGFFKNSLYADYRLEVLLISKDAKDYRTDFTKNGTYNFDHEKDVIDIKRLLKIIEDKELDQIKKISLFLDKQILTERSRTECNEVETIMSLIAFLSEDKNRQHIQKEITVDPERKITNRFSSHSKYLLDRYQSMVAYYYGPLAEATKGMDSMKTMTISNYLQDESDAMLTKCDNNPKEALRELVNFFSDKLSSNGFQSFHKQAIHFFLLEEMIKCNVFPLTD